MSTIWTPGGEHPVGDRPGDQPTGQPAPPGPLRATEGSGAEPSPDELEAELAEVQRQLAETPVDVVVANHAIGLFQLAALHLNQQPPNLGDARLAVDAMAALVEGLSGRLGEQEAALREALTQLRLGFVEVSRRVGESDPGPPPSPTG